MAGFDLATATFAIPWWGSLAAAVLLATLVVLAIVRSGAALTLGAVGAFTIAVMGLLLGWSHLDRMIERDRADALRAFQTRVADVASRALAPGSSLSCLDGLAGDAVLNACEKTVFANPESVASAVSYTAARLSLLTEAIEFAGRSDAALDNALASLRRPLEMDRFGIVAHVLATRDQCTPDACDALSLLEDPSRIVANLKDRVFDATVERHAADWAKVAPVASAPGFSLAGAGPHAPNAPSPDTPATASFPSAASIPPVSIMNNEPGIPGQNGVEAEAKAEAKTPLPTPRPRRSSTAARTSAPAPADGAPASQ